MEAENLESTSFTSNTETKDLKMKRNMTFDISSNPFMADY